MDGRRAYPFPNMNNAVLHRARASGGLPDQYPEPQFNAGTSLIGSKDGTFDSYADTTALRAAWITDGTLISPGRGGSGHACRLSYAAAGSGVEVDHFVEAQWTRVAHVAFSFYFRTSLNADPTSGRFDSSGFKYCILHRDGDHGDPNGRITAGVTSLQGGLQFGTPDAGVQFTLNDQSVVAGGFWQNISKYIGWNATNSHGTTNRTVPVNDTNWHRYTIEADPFQDLVRVWVDGILIINSAGLTYPMFDQGWDGMSLGANVVPDLLAGYDFTLDFDDLQMWSIP